MDSVAIALLRTNGDASSSHDAGRFARCDLDSVQQYGAEH
jgi:hypothetical protein